VQFHPADPDTPITYTLTRKAEAELDRPGAEPGRAAREPEAEL